jgi:hypothetical protein
MTHKDYYKLHRSANPPSGKCVKKIRRVSVKKSKLFDEPAAAGEEFFDFSEPGGFLAILPAAAALFGSFFQLQGKSYTAFIHKFTLGIMPMVV